MPSFSTIDRHSGVSAWKQIADQISGAIASGDFDETGMVPPETVLAEKFGVNRHTVRNAIAALAEDGLLTRVQGRGTLIEKRQRLVLPIGRRTRFSEGLGKQATESAMRLLSAETVEATEEIAGALALDTGTPLFRLRTLSLADNRPVSLGLLYFDRLRFPRMPELVKHHQSVTKAFAEQGLPDYVRVSTEVSGRLATSDEISELGLPVHAVILDATSVNADLEGRPVQYSRTAFAADRISLRLDTMQV
jgi:GntR family phosphonate transport system transcriptional regulator